MSNKILFIDRDGTLIKEPIIDFQVDSLGKLEFYPGVFTYLGRIVKELDFRLVMVTNQDGLGTSSFPEDTFWPAHNKMMQAFENEGIIFEAVFIDKSFENDQLPTRKPGIGMLSGYLSTDYDLKSSYVIGDRASDVQLAQNIGCGSIYLGNEDIQVDLKTNSWQEIYEYLRQQQRSVTIVRETAETHITISLSLNGIGKNNIKTGLGFFDHMLEQISKHGLFDLDIQVVGDLEIDEHHTIEDVAITLGQAFNEALGQRKGIERYGFLLPMDDCLVQVAIDFGGRPWCVWNAKFKREKIGDMPTEMFFHFFKSFTDHAKCNLNITAKGKNEHHKIESIFKAFAKALKMAVSNTPDFLMPSTKGTI